MNRVLTPLAVALAGVTATSVGMAVFSAISDPVLATLFAGAGVLLDVFKYAAWPAAADLLTKGRGVLAVATVACAVAFAGVSCWATFDRLVGAIEGRAAGSEQRLVDLEQVQRDGQLRVSTLDSQLTDTRKQAALMREHGMASKSFELEQGAIARADIERAAAMAKVESASSERNKLLSTRGTTLPAGVIFLIGLGFALALEVVPVLIFLSGSQEEKPRPKPAAELRRDEPVTRQEQASNLREPTETLGDPLLHQLRVAGAELLKVKEFAKANGIGNTRASAVYKAAEVAGIIKKTATGYVAQEIS
jgi:hypothetical protein